MEQISAERKVLAETNKLIAYEVRLEPGCEAESVRPAHHVIRVIKGGTMIRQHSDGKTEEVQWKTGEVRAISPFATAFTPKNIGNTEVVLFIVELK